MGDEGVYRLLVRAAIFMGVFVSGFLLYQTFVAGRPPGDTAYLEGEQFFEDGPLRANARSLPRSARACARTLPCTPRPGPYPHADRAPRGRTRGIRRVRGGPPGLCPALREPRHPPRPDGLLPPSHRRLRNRVGPRPFAGRRTTLADPFPAQPAAAAARHRGTRRLSALRTGQTRSRTRKKKSNAIDPKSSRTKSDPPSSSRQVGPWYATAAVTARNT